MVQPSDFLEDFRPRSGCSEGLSLFPTGRWTIGWSFGGGDHAKSRRNTVVSKICTLLNLRLVKGTAPARKGLLGDHRLSLQ
jgi:hypothetical protein